MKVKYQKKHPTANNDLKKFIISETFTNKILNYIIVCGLVAGVARGLPRKKQQYNNQQGSFMFSSKKRHSWYLIAIAALIFAGIVFTVARFFLHAIDKEARCQKKNHTKASNGSWEDLFV